ncbi:hypothetical protein EDB89DRAFT_1901964 [Lactarius sanguifluus]|nr:hypothetical protein EDB89DRAFT_1901961 [Lactarius sanguifluus]KAH9177861.1 hypothetical protein EDB89DRAFT_1901964 [Lactarius sanguifluus]
MTWHVGLCVAVVSGWVDSCSLVCKAGWLGSGAAWRVAGMKSQDWAYLAGLMGVGSCEVFRVGGVGGDASGLVNRVGGTIITMAWCWGGAFTWWGTGGGGCQGRWRHEPMCGEALESCVSQRHGARVGFRAAGYWWWWRLMEMGPQDSCSGDVVSGGDAVMRCMKSPHLKSKGWTVHY